MKAALYSNYFNVLTLCFLDSFWLYNIFPLVQVLNAIPFIAEFSLSCSNKETPLLYAEVEGNLIPVTQSTDGSKDQVGFFLRNYSILKDGL